MRGQWRRIAALALRDGAIVGVVLALWGVLRDVAPGGAGHLALSTVTALLTTGLGYLAHEWGHLLGCIVSRSAFELPRTPFHSFFLFRFDRERNTRRQFFAMALGGFAASIVSVPLFLLLLPAGMLATWMTLALVALGVAATLIVEMPEFLGVWRGGPLPGGAAFVSGEPRVRD